MRCVLPALCALALTITAAAEEPLLNRLSVHATGSVMITIPVDKPPTGSVFRLPDGSWEELKPQYFDGQMTFLVSPKTGGSTIILLNVPEWLELDDDAAPIIRDLAVDDSAVEAAPEVNLGHTSPAPATIRFVVQDDKNPIDVGLARVTLDGAPLAQGAVEFRPVKDGPQTRLVQVNLGDLPRQVHTLAVRIPDAAPVPHFAEMKVRFTNAPLVTDGGFEQLKADGTPIHWGANRWSAEADTKANLKIVEGGHTGKHCAEITGISGRLNLLWGQQVPLTGDRSYTVRGMYKATSSGAYMSLIADGKQAKEQYLNSPRLKPTEDWTPFEWTFDIKPADRYTLYLRSTAKGSVWFDDVVMEQTARAD